MNVELLKAKQIALAKVEYLAPYCERIAIAGSVRREKPDVKDLEIVCIPKMIAKPGVMFSNDDFTTEPFTQSALTTDVVLPMGSVKKCGDRYKQIVLPEGISLDLFCVLPPAQWGVLFTQRTGPWDFSQWVVTQKRKGGALPSNLKVADGAVWDGDTIVPTPEEEDFFKVLCLPWIEPSKRVSGWRKAP